MSPESVTFGRTRWTSRFFTPHTADVLARRVPRTAGLWKGAVPVGALVLVSLAVWHGSPASRLSTTAEHYAARQLGTPQLQSVGQYQGGECRVVEVKTAADRVIHSVIFVKPDYSHPIAISSDFTQSKFVPDSDDLCGLTSSSIVTSDGTGRLTQHGTR